MSKLEQLKKKMEDAKVAHNARAARDAALDAHNDALDAAHAAAYAAYNKSINKKQ